MKPILVLGLLLALAPAAAQTATSDPDSARIVTADVARFWRAYDRLATATTREDSLRALQEDYLDPATPGLRAFAGMRLDDRPDGLLYALRLLPRYYAAVREATLRLDDREPVVRNALRRLEAVYPEATFPEVTFLISGFGTMGTLAREGLLIGAEMVSADADTPLDELPDFMRDVDLTQGKLPCIVVHELVHHQQEIGGEPSLLRQAIVEGGADFVTALAVPECFPTPTYAWADAREGELWAEFSEAMHGDDLRRWFYNGRDAGDRPDNLGYWVGYRIAEAYYDRMEDKERAVWNLLHVRAPAAFLTASGYGAK